MVLRRGRELMVRAALLSLAAAIVLLAWNGDRRTWERPDILHAIRMVESGGVANPPDGDGGRAIGPYQIHRVYWKDATEFDPSLGGRYEDCREVRYAERVIDSYMRRYVPAAWRDNDAETIARTHNGGPTGKDRPETGAYWEAVRARLE